MVRAATLAALVLLAGCDKPIAVQADLKKPDYEPGRYQMYFSPFMRADTFIVDTKGGQVWQMVADKEGNTRFQTVPMD